MASKAKTPAPYVLLHKNGVVWARGQTVEGVAVGYWEWFRKDGVRMRSGSFENGRQSGEWITYDRTGGVYKSTMMSAESESKAKPARSPVAKKKAAKKTTARKTAPKAAASKSSVVKKTGAKPKTVKKSARKG
jgi:hypothetical protein